MFARRVKVDAKAVSEVVLVLATQSLQRKVYWWCTEQMLTVPGAVGRDLLVDDGGVATLLIRKGHVWEEKYGKDGSLLDPATADHPGD